MKVQDREVVKNLLQYLTSKNLTGSVEFREALKTFQRHYGLSLGKQTF
ncbi:Uncharacterised protein [Escherichia coli]|uniref:Uncharacterized protein n=1 Tax=Escherichia coli TaxID=562 RepID=A0A377AK06_ECOLX|nr:Uncharacterised protein [Escherichia coli]